MKPVHILSLGALVSLLVLLICAYQWGVPWAADEIAQQLPQSLAKKIGDEELATCDAKILKPSTLPAADQVRLHALFAGLRQPYGHTPYQLLFRNSLVGPNAFALPNGTIIMTDQLVRLAADDQAILGVLAHELGHVKRRHTLRNFVQTLGVGILLNLWIGDMSSTLMTMPTFMLNQKYSRDFEREADQHAIDMMHVNRLPLAPMADMFEKLETMKQAALNAAAERERQRNADEDDEEDDARPAQTGKTAPKRKLPPDYLSSHPSDRERIIKLRAADPR